jgi:hypothetical protein
MKLYYSGIIDNNRQMKLYYLGCIDNNKQMKLYYPVCIDNNKHNPIELCSTGGINNNK